MNDEPNGSYTRPAITRYKINMVTERLPSATIRPPASNTATIPNRKKNCANVTAIPGGSSFWNAQDTTCSNFLSTSSRYAFSSPSERSSFITSKYSCTLSYAARCASRFRSSAFICFFRAASTTSAEIGTGRIIHNPIRQSITSNPQEIMINMMTVPKKPGTAFENMRSNFEQSPIIVVVKSDRSL